jgi:crotonobetainyl-CoA:carnitine CoA-transferase CaiB-like acyl-CoA transferase
MIQGLAGVMDLTGAPDGPPFKAGYATADLFCGLYATVGILARAAPAGRDRGRARPSTWP